ncbi:hypothetical protein [Streptomyces sp. NPDC056401]|uniref:hypothetical protein n=1 Tax=Streptomyces sp. NPDC056401 TaxID=3345809 RepID=UPI0035E363CB
MSLSSSQESELAAARIVERVAGRKVEPYDECVECGAYHDGGGSTSGRYDFHQGEDGALEVTFATSRVAERNQRDWNRYLTPSRAPTLGSRWHVMVDSAVKTKAPRGKKGARESREFLEAVVPALEEMERRGVSDLPMGKTCDSAPFHDPACPYGVLSRAGVVSAWAEPEAEGAGEITAGVLFGFDGMPAFDEEDEKKKEAGRRKKARAKGEGERPDSEPAASVEASLGPVRSFAPDFIARLESRRADDELREAACLRTAFPGRLPESEVVERARRIVDERIELAKAVTWREGLPSLPRPRGADAGTDLVDLLEGEFSLHPDLAAKLLRADSRRVRREVFFWLTWTRAPAWNRLVREGLLPGRAPELPAGVTGIWVGFLADRAQVLHWTAETGWIRHSPEDPLPASVCRR